MDTGLVHLHNIIRWVILVLLVVAILRHLSAMNSKRPYSSADRKTDLFLMIAAHVQFLIGLYMWFFRPLGYQLLTSMPFADIMKNPGYRFWTVEHNTGMLIGIVLITIGRGVVKKNLPDAAKHKRAFWIFFAALIIILVSVPWPWREAIARPIFPGM